MNDKTCTGGSGADIMRAMAISAGERIEIAQEPDLQVDFLAKLCATTPTTLSSG